MLNAGQTDARGHHERKDGDHGACEQLDVKLGDIVQDCGADQQPNAGPWQERAQDRTLDLLPLPPYHD
jgi:hypothetical protein